MTIADRKGLTINPVRCANEMNALELRCWRVYYDVVAEKKRGS